MARRLTQQEQEEFFASMAAAPDSEPGFAFTSQADSAEARTWAGIPDSIDLDFLDGFDFPPKG